MRFRLIPAIAVAAGPTFGDAIAQVPAQSPPQQPSARAGHAFVFDAARVHALVIGGETGSADRRADSLWAFTGEGWRALGGASPVWVTLPAATFDVRRSRLVVFGGKTKTAEREWGPASSQTWEWDGRSWHRGPDGPLPLDHHSAAYDAARGQTVVYGGVNPNVDPDPGKQHRNVRTWLYDGATWRSAGDSIDGPGVRYHFAMAYDSRRERVVLYGGMRGVGAQDTWEWDGMTWRRFSVPGPGVRMRHRLAFDAARGVTILFGGTQDSDTWQWDGSVWSRVSSAGPPPRIMHAMTYDSSRQRVLLYGGFRESGDSLTELADLWEWDGSRWRQIPK